MIPSASKIEIHHVLESLYGFDVTEVRTLNKEGKKRKRGGILITKPDYKKAYITLRTPLSLSPDDFPIRVVEEERVRTKQQAQRQSVVGDNERGGDGKGVTGLMTVAVRGIVAIKGAFFTEGAPSGRRRRGSLLEAGGGGRKVGMAVAIEEGSWFPWIIMRYGKK